MQPLHGALLFTALSAVIWLVGSIHQPVVRFDPAQLPATAAGSSADGFVDERGVATGEVVIDTLRTFRGAKPDGALRIDVENHLVIDLNLRHWFDFYLAAQGELPLADIIEVMQSQIDHLPDPAQRQASDLLQQYLGYLNALEQYDQEQQKRVVTGLTSDMIERARWQQRLRQQWFSAQVVEAFFSADELLDNYMIERLQAQQSGATAQQLAELEQKLPAAIQQMRQQTRAVTSLNVQESELRRQGASPEAIQQWRQQQFGEEVAGRLAEVDLSQQQWQQRLLQYLDYRDSQSLQGVDPRHRDKLLQTYRDRHFTITEQKRLPAAIQLLDHSDN